MSGENLQNTFFTPAFHFRWDRNVYSHHGKKKAVEKKNAVDIDENLHVRMHSISFNKQPYKKDKG